MIMAGHTMATENLVGSRKPIVAARSMGATRTSQRVPSAASASRASGVWTGWPLHGSVQSSGQSIFMNQKSATIVSAGQKQAVPGAQARPL